MAPWVYDWAADPAGAASVVSRVRSQLFPDTPGGIPGNDDLGAMGALLVWSAIGMYPAFIATADTVLNSPEFPTTIIHLPNGGSITINAPQASSSNVFVLSLALNGAAYTKPWLPASIFTGGATLDFTLGSAAGSFGTSPADAPPSFDGVPGAATFNNAGISSDSAPASANYDGVGFSYSANALSAAGVNPGGTVTAGGLSFRWPNVPAGQLDNFQAAGQTVAVAGASGAGRIGLLGSATNVGSAGSRGTVVVHFTDGTTQSIAMTLSDWTLGAGAFAPVAGNVTAVTTPYRNSTSGTRQTVNTMVFEVGASLTAGKTVASVTLPSTLSGGQFHVFAIAIG